MAFSETLEDKWTALGLRKSQFSRKDNLPRSTRQLVSYQPGPFLSGMVFYLFCMLYVNDGAFVFESRTNTEKGIILLSKHFNQFGLVMYIGTETTPSNTECVFSPAPGLFNTRTIPLIYFTNSTFSLQKKENDKIDAHI